LLKSLATIDSTYCGEIKVIIDNFSDSDFVIKSVIPPYRSFSLALHFGCVYMFFELEVKPVLANSVYDTKSDRSRSKTTHRRIL